jgi:hypothetical protein
MLLWIDRLCLKQFDGPGQKYSLQSHHDDTLDQHSILFPLALSLKGTVGKAHK